MQHYCLKKKFKECCSVVDYFATTSSWQSSLFVIYLWEIYIIKDWGLFLFLPWERKSYPDIFLFWLPLMISLIFKCAVIHCYDVRSSRCLVSRDRVCVYLSFRLRWWISRVTVAESAWSFKWLHFNFITWYNIMVLFDTRVELKVIHLLLLRVK